MLELLAVAAAGAGAGAANSVAGGGALITFPTMVALGLPPLTANVTNTIGIVPASIGGALGYRDLLREQGERFSRLLPPLLLGAVAGSAALLVTSNEAFVAIVPVLIAASCLLLLLQPRLVPHISHAGNERSPYLLAAVIFAFLAPVEWSYVAVLMVSSLLGGRVGAHYARRIPSGPLRISIAGAGLAVAVVLGLRAFG